MEHEIIADLLPLYHDGVCSEKSRQAVEAHLAECASCREALEALDTPLPKPAQSADGQAAVLKRLSQEWKRGRWIAWLKGAAIAGGIFLLLMGAWIAATEWFIIPAETGDIQLTDVRQLSDGRVLYHLYIDDQRELRLLSFEYAEIDGEGQMFFVPKYAVCAGKRTYPSLSDSEQELDFEVLNAYARIEGIEEEITKIWYGQGEDAILLWEAGMALPAASAQDEEEYGHSESEARYYEEYYGPVNALP